MRWRHAAAAEASASVGRGLSMGGGRRSGLRGVARGVPGLSCSRSKAEIAIRLQSPDCNHAGDCNLHQARRGSGLEAHRARRIQGDMGEIWGRCGEVWGRYGRDLIRWALGRWEHPPSTPALAGPCLWRGPFVGEPWRARIYYMHARRRPTAQGPAVWGDRGRW